MKNIWTRGIIRQGREVFELYSGAQLLARVESRQQAERLERILEKMVDSITQVVDHIEGTAQIDGVAWLEQARKVLDVHQVV